MEKIFPRRAAGKAVDDPVLHSRDKTGYECSLLRDESPWGDNETFYTTRDFDRLGQKYHKHCGPTAITNIICSVARRCSRADLLKMPREEIFRKVVAIGKKRATYWNIRDDVPLGGTSYLLLMGYIHACLHRFGMDSTRMTGRLAATPREMADEIRRGSLLVLSLYHHRYYGNHIVVACGATEVSVPGNHAPRLYLKIADGWVGRPRYIAAEDLRRAGYVAIRL